VTELAESGAVDEVIMSIAGHVSRAIALKREAREWAGARLPEGSV